MNSPMRLARPDLQDLTPYDACSPGPGVVRLHANESPWRRSWDESAAGLNRYPDPVAGRLTSRLAQVYGAPREELLLTRGSDDAIDLLVRAFCIGGRDNIVTCPPTFPMYAMAARLQGAGVREAPLAAAEDFAVDESAICESASSAKLVFLCSPNNPTGGVVTNDAVARLCRTLSGRALVIVDEAYAEFSGRPSAIALRRDHSNLVILRTLSKAYALAGLRIGTVIAHPDVVRLLRAILPPYPLPSPCLEAATRTLSDVALAAARSEVEATLVRKARFADSLAGIPCVRKIWPGEANFLLIRVRDARRVTSVLRAQDVLVRDFANVDVLQDCVRISIGEERENDKALTILEAIS